MIRSDRTIRRYRTVQVPIVDHLNLPNAHKGDLVVWNGICRVLNDAGWEMAGPYNPEEQDVQGG